MRQKDLDMDKRLYNVLVFRLHDYIHVLLLKIWIDFGTKVEPYRLVRHEMALKRRFDRMKEYILLNGCSVSAMILETFLTTLLIYILSEELRVSRITVDAFFIIRFKMFWLHIPMLDHQTMMLKERTL